MHLKKIELFGFKSFADKTEVVFEKGVTCIVGPNGCGKSNISDAIRWVLGERSAKLLRGAKMEDVIFSGTDYRKPLNLAEVSLTIDNTDQKLPIQYEEVTISRRLYRSGESEYLLNKTPCRLKDVQDLILDTGIGSNSYSMIEQGRIDYILSAEADERRFLIEEAAGISKYKVKKEEALRKLERTEENLIRLNDIISEVERNIRYAERQAHRAARYKDDLEHLKEKEIRKAFFDIQKFQVKTDAISKERGERNTVIAVLEQQLTGETAAVRELENKLHVLEQRFFEQESARSDVKQKIISLENHENFHREKIESLKLACEKALGELESLAKRTESVRADIDKKSDEQNQVLKDIAGIQQLKTEKESCLKDISQYRESVHHDLKEGQSALFALAQQTADQRNELSRIRFELMTLERSRHNMSENKNKILEGLGGSVERHQVLEDECLSHESKQADITQRLHEKIEQKTSLTAQLEGIRLELSELRNQQSECERQVLVLEKLDEAEGTDPDQGMSQIKQSENGHLLKALFELIQVEQGYEHACEAVLSDGLKAIVADRFDSLDSLVSQLKTFSIRRTKIFIKDLTPQTSSPALPSHPLIEKRLIDVMQIQDSYRPLFESLIGNVCLIQDASVHQIRELLELAGDCVWVTKSGLVFGPRHQVIVHHPSTNQNVWLRKKSIEELKQQNGRLAQRISETQSKEKQLESDIGLAADNERRLREELTDSQAIAEHVKGKTLGLTEQSNRLREELHLIELEESQNQLDTEEFTKKEAVYQIQLTQLEASEAETRSQLRIIEDRIQQEKDREQEVLKEIAYASARLDGFIEKEKDYGQTLNFLGSQLDDILSRTDILTHEREFSKNEVLRLSGELEQFGREKEELHRVLLERSVEVEQTKNERAELYQERTQVSGQLQETAKKLEDEKHKAYESDLQTMDLNHHIESISQALETRYKINLSQLDPANYPLAEVEYEQISSEVDRLREKLESIGAVNLLAIDEFNELKGRYEFLLSQKKDLTDAREQLLEAIRKINRTTKKLFDETLSRVRQAFQEYFRILFGGGQADLVLLDEANPLDSGLDIIARPPGKKMQHVTLLSGGEKAMTAISLLVALFSVRPSPFCVLDEVDAPLDEANTDRFLSVLKPFLETTQFIMVTHSRKTIAMGDTLYGITMQEAGVSKVVSVKLASDSTVEHENPELAQQLNQVLA